VREIGQFRSVPENVVRTRPNVRRFGDFKRILNVSGKLNRRDGKLYVFTVEKWSRQPTVV
jgi:hypothetical protein